MLCITLLCLSILIRFIVNSFDSSTTWVVLSLERSIPRQCLGSRASYAGHTWHTKSRTTAWEMFFKNGAIIIFFFIHRCVDRETLCCISHLLVGHSGRSYLFQCINPAITHNSTNLPCLAPCPALWQHISKCFTNNLLLNCFSRSHFCFGIRAHSNV